MPVSESTLKKWEKMDYRQLYTEVMLHLARMDERVVMSVADLGRVVGGERFSAEFPDRYVNAGIAEACAVSVSAGLATLGKVVFFSTFAPFASMRDLEQVRSDCAYMDLPVRIVGTDCGVAMPGLGNTHFGLEDIGVMRAIPGLAVICPADARQFAVLAEQLLNYPRAAYIRLPGSQKAEPVYKENRAFEIGKAETLREGKHVTIISCGYTVASAVKAAELLEKAGISAGVIDMHTVKPIDERAVLTAAEKGLIITVEEHVANSGLGGAVAEVMAAAGKGRLVKLGFPDAYMSTVSSYDEFMDEFGLTPRKIAKRVSEELA